MQDVTNVNSQSSVSSFSYVKYQWTSSTSTQDATTSQGTGAAPTDAYIPSGQAPANQVAATTDGKASGNPLQGFDLKAFQQQIHQQLLDTINAAKDALGQSGTTTTPNVSDILYKVDDTTKAADVPKEWNADSTSQRIVDFAMQFRDAAKASGMSDEDFKKQITDAISEGFRQAKNDLKDLPGPVAKLFNDTYQATLDKLDKAFSTSGSSATSGTPTSTSSDAAANAQAPAFTNPSDAASSSSSSSESWSLEYVSLKYSSTSSTSAYASNSKLATPAAQQAAPSYQVTA